MKRLRRKQAPERTVHVGSHEDKLSRLGAIRSDPDERPTREDRQGHRSPFDIPVPLPRMLQRRRRRKNRGQDGSA